MVWRHSRDGTRSGGQGRASPEFYSPWRQLAKTRHKLRGLFPQWAYILPPRQP